MTNMPIFIIASERSGTNLLRRRLTEVQKRYFGPSPLHFLKHMFSAEPFYGDLMDNENFYNFIEDSLGLAYEHFSPWDEILTKDEVFILHDKLFGKQRTAIKLMHTIYTIYANKKGYESYICKDNNLFDFISDIRLELPLAKFIYLYRDPRDVVLSQLKRPLQIKNINYLSNLWKDEQIKSIRGTFNNKDNVFFISYEEFIKNEEKILKELLSFFGIEQVSNQKAFKNEKTDIHEWKNLEKPTIVDNSKKFLKELSNNEINIIEQVCWYQMLKLGYKTINQTRPKQKSKYISKLMMMFDSAKLIIKIRFFKNDVTNMQLKQIEYISQLYKKWK